MAFANVTSRPLSRGASLGIVLLIGACAACLFWLWWSGSGPFQPRVIRSPYVSSEAGLRDLTLRSVSVSVTELSPPHYTGPALFTYSRTGSSASVTLPASSVPFLDPAPRRPSFGAVGGAGITVRYDPLRAQVIYLLRQGGVRVDAPADLSQQKSEALDSRTAELRITVERTKLKDAVALQLKWELSRPVVLQDEPKPILLDATLLSGESTHCRVRPQDSEAAIEYLLTAMVSDFAASYRKQQVSPQVNRSGDSRGTAETSQ